MSGLYLYVLSFLIFLSTAAYYFLRKQQKFQIRCPGLSLSAGFIDFVLVVTIDIQIKKGKGLNCLMVLWSGNLLMNLLFVVCLLRMWIITLMSDRTLQERFKWTLKPKGMLLIFSFATTFGVFTTVLVQMFSAALVQEKCRLLMPWWEFMPQIAVSLILRVILGTIRHRRSLKELGSNTRCDFCGIDFELNAATVVGGGFLILYLVYANFFSSKTFDHPEPGKLFPPEYVLAMVPAVSCLMTLSVPCVKFLCATKRSPKVYMSLDSSPQRIVEILGNSKRARAFREIAKEAMCAESVDFCLEVLLYKNNAKVEEDINSDTVCLHRNFMSIVSEFIIDKAPQEVNISSECKKEIMQYRDYSQFCSLGHAKQHAVFDEAEKELHFLLRANVLDSFAGIALGLCLSSNYRSSSHEDQKTDRSR